MKLTLIVGSHRKNGRSSRIAMIAAEEAQKLQADLSVAAYSLADYRIDPCQSCYKCAEPHECVIQGDDFPFLFEAMASSDSILFVCPHYAPIPSKMAALLERMEAVCYFSCQEDRHYVPPVKGKRCSIITLRGAGGAVFGAHQALVVQSIVNAVTCGDFVGMRPVDSADLGAEEPDTQQNRDGIRGIVEALIVARVPGQTVPREGIDMPATSRPPATTRSPRAATSGTASIRTD